MRSDLIYAAGLQVENRFLLASTAMRAVRKLHVDASRTEDTINRILVEIAQSRPFIGALPEVVPPPPIDTLIITTSI